MKHKKLFDVLFADGRNNRNDTNVECCKNMHVVYIVRSEIRANLKNCLSQEIMCIDQAKAVMLDHRLYNHEPKMVIIVCLAFHS